MPVARSPRRPGPGRRPRLTARIACRALPTPAHRTDRWRAPGLLPSPAVPASLRLAPVLAALTGCAGIPYHEPAPQVPGAAGPGAPAAMQGPPTTLLSAQVVPPGPAERDHVLPVRAVVHLVFSRPLDPLTLVPAQFVLALADGRRVAPVGAFLAPGTGAAGQRSVALLLGDGGGAGAAGADPISVTVTGLLHDASGRVLEGLALDVAPRSQAVFVVRAEAGADPRCAGQALQLYWSAPVRLPSGAAPGPLVTRADGTRGPAQLVDDGGAVLGLCAPGLAGVLSVELPAGAFIDERGQAVAAGALAITTPA